MALLPSGTVTFLFTDIQGSTQLWDKHRQAMGDALRRHDELMRQAIETNEGYVFKTIGDAFCVAFSSAIGALSTAIQAQQMLTREPWGETPIKVRIGLHTGQAEERDGDYFGPALNRTARLMSAGHGGQILLSLATQELVRDHLPTGVSLRDLGDQLLKDLIRPERIYQVVAPDLPQDFAPLKTLGVHPNNLPVQVTSFVGREREMKEVKDLLKTTHLLTLTGSGGAGKTRLALQVGADLVDEFAHGVWLVELASLSDPTLVPQAVANALGVKEEAKRPVIETLSDYLREKELLLILDNCEHLIEVCATLAECLIRSSTQFKMLATSQEALRIAGEINYRVPSLSLPDPHQLPVLSSLTQYEAVRLFIDRAISVQPHFAVTNANAPAVAQICQQLDGIPLAIELAAARLRSMVIEEINRRLAERFRLLTGGSRTALPRQQTLRAMIDWSWGLLTEKECALLRRLSVFAGGWTLEGAEIVCAGEGLEIHEVLDLLSELVEKSLVVWEEERDRYRLLETVKQYSREQLALSGEEEKAYRQKHGKYFLNLTQEAAPKLRGTGQEEWLQRLEEEHDNLRCALEWAVESDPETGCELAAELGELRKFWEVRGYLSEGRQWLQKLLAEKDTMSKTAQAKALSAAGSLALCQADYTAASVHAEAGLSIYRALGDKQRIADALVCLGNLAWLKGEYEKATHLSEESVTLSRERDYPWGTADSLHNLGNIARSQDKLDQVRIYHEKSLSIRRDIGDKQGIAESLNSLGEAARAQEDYAIAGSMYEESVSINKELGYKRGIALALNNLAITLIAQGEYARARTLLKEGLLIRRELGVKLGFAYSLDNFAYLAAELGHAERAARLWGAAEALREMLGVPLVSEGGTTYQEQKLGLRAQRDEASVIAAWTKGRAMTVEQAIEYALEKDSHG